MESAWKHLISHVPVRLQMHRYSGYFLALFIAGHIVATRGPALLYGIYPEFGGVAFTFQWLPLWFYPYYPLLALAGLLHLAIGVPLALAVVGVRVPRGLQQGRGARWALGTAAVLLWLGVAGLGGLLYEVPDQAAHPFAVKVREVSSGLFE